ncbi:MAG: histidine kinase [Gammaproteobacteria bacterium]|nr:histidine kinase [Gammaproteobacteria bacterium]
MSFELEHLFAAGVAYLSLLFLIAYAVERGWLPRRIARHPATYVLSLGVYATSWTYYGSVGFAQTQGFNFLTIYIGVTLAFLLAPVLLRPLLRLTREYQLTSLADVFAFRYPSRVTGILVTLFMLAGTLPYLALQIRAVTESAQALTQEATPAEMGLSFCVTLILFAILFGARHVSPREKHEGLVTAIAFESLVKLGALLLVGAFAVFGVFGGVGAMNDWVETHPRALEALYRPVREGPWGTLLLLAFAAAFLLPRQFHMAFTENIDSRALPAASWGFPLFLLLLNLPILPVLWAGTLLTPEANADYYVLGITLSSGSPALSILAFIGGVSAASAMMIVTTLALTAMCLNHMLLPASYPDPQLDIYRWLLWGRRMIITIIILTGYGFYLILEHNQGLVQLGLISFVAVAQFLPGVAGLFYWRRATRAGFLAGLSGGAAVWVATLLAPLLERSGIIHTGLSWSVAEAFGLDDPWSFATFTSLSANGLLFVGVSLLTRQSPAEQDAAQACCRESMAPPRGVVAAASPEQFRELLARTMGSEAADWEVRRALEDLSMGPGEHRPAELRRLRERIKRNLSGLLGPTLAHMIVEDRLRLDMRAQAALADTVRFMEQRLEDSHTRLQGLAGELDALRRYHRQVLQELPLGVCSLGPDGEVVTWNRAMERLSGIDADRAVGAELATLPGPWGPTLGRFRGTPEAQLYKLRVDVGDGTRWVNLHKAAIEDPTVDAPGPPAREGPGGLVILAEDVTEVHTLESELAHSERLASIGRLAAGVAHEVGNPLTGIASLTQNLREEPDRQVVDESIEQILAQIDRISAIVRSLVTYGHVGTRSEHAGSPFDLHACVDEAIRLVRLSHAGKQVKCVNRCKPALELTADRQRILQVLVNLLTNACDASEPGDSVEVRAAAGNPGGVHIEVVDRGSGIPETLRERVLEPFFTTKPPGQGTGLGLALVYNIVRDHGGTLRLESPAEGGTRVSVHLPDGRGDPVPPAEELLERP